MSLGDILIVLLSASGDAPVLAAAKRLEVRYDAGLAALVFAKAAETSEAMGVHCQDAARRSMKCCCTKARPWARTLSSWAAMGARACMKCCLSA